MDRIRYLIAAPVQKDAPTLVELRPFKAALACEHGVITATLQSYCSRPLTLEISAVRDGAAAPELLPHPNMIELKPGASQRIRIGLRLGALHVERAFCLVLRETALRRDASFFRLEMALPLIVAPVAYAEALRAA